MNITLMAYVIFCLALLTIDGMAVYYNHTFLLRFGIYSPYFLQVGKKQRLDSFGIVQNLYRKWYGFDYSTKKTSLILVLDEKEGAKESEEAYISRKYSQKYINRTDLIKFFWWSPYLFFLLSLLLIYPLLPVTYRVIVPSVALVIPFGISTSFFIGWGHITHSWGAIYAIGLFLVARIEIEAPQLFSKVFNPGWSQFGTFIGVFGALLGGTVWAMMNALFDSTYYTREEKNILGARVITGALGAVTLLAMLFMAFLPTSPTPYPTSTPLPAPTDTSTPSKTPEPTSAPTALPTHTLTPSPTPTTIACADTITYGSGKGEPRAIYAPSEAWLTMPELQMPWTTNRQRQLTRACT